MRILVVGAGRAGARVIEQLQKNPEITVITADPREEPQAVQEGIIPKVDILEVFTPLTLEFILKEARPDMILLAMATEDMALGQAPGIDVLADALREEMAAISEIPLIVVARGGL
jgi:nucleoside-diphosphate-sugar epimerase